MKSYVGLSHYHHSTFVITHKHVVDISVWQFPVNPSYFQLRFTCHKYYIIGSLIFPNEVLQFCQGGYQIQCSIIIPVWHAKPGCSQFTIWNNVHDSLSEMTTSLRWGLCTCCGYVIQVAHICCLSSFCSFSKTFCSCHQFLLIWCSQNLNCWHPVHGFHLLLEELPHCCFYLAICPFL